MMKSLMLTILIFLSFTLFGQQSKIVDAKVENSTVEFLGKTGKLLDLVQLEATDKIKKDKFRKDKKVPDNFRNRVGKNNVVLPELEHQPDEVLQKNYKFTRSVADEPLVNIDGLATSFGSPSDPTGATGKDYYMQAVNSTRVGVWDKEGSLELTFNMNTLWTSVGGSSAGDPIILYDQEEDRWILTEFTDPANLLIAVSETEDPFGSYFAYSFSTPNFPDYPKYSIWTDHLVVTTNEEGSGSLHQYFIDRHALLAGENDVRMQRVEVSGTNSAEQGFITSTPVDWEGRTRPDDPRPIVVKLNDSSWGELPEDAVELYRFNIDYDSGTAEVESTVIPTSPYDSYPCAALTGGFACTPQPDNADGLDALPEIIVNGPQYRNFGSHESIVLSFVTDVANGANHSGIRWMELRRSSSDDWDLYQEGSYAPDDDHRFMPAIGIDARGNIGMAYVVSGFDTYAGIRYTGRKSGDPLGEMTVEEVSVIEGGSALNSFGRFADYPQIAVDPVNEKTFWYTCEYAGNTGNARTRIVAFELQPDTFDIRAVSILRPSTSFQLTSSEQVEMEVQNTGIESLTSYDIGFLLDGTLIQSKTITEELLPGDIRKHVFENTIDLSAIGDYQITSYSTNTLDSNIANDTITTLVRQLPAIDVGLSATGAEAVCSENAEFTITVINNGGMTMTMANIEVSLDGSVVDNIAWTGSLDYEDSERIDYTLNGVAEGSHTVNFTITNPAGDDFANADNSQSLDFNILGGTGLITLVLNTDEYPEETTWELTDDLGEVLFSGGPYEEELTEIRIDMCVQPDGCYTFSIFDVYNDGICCGFGEGNYSLLNANLTTIFSSDGDFGGEESTDFCAGDVECAITATIEVVDTDTNTGSILITPTGGIDPYSYSIDGGTTFQESNLFDNLLPGEYNVYVLSGDGVCVFEAIVLVDVIDAVDDANLEGLKMSVTPNPNNGLFHVNVEYASLTKPFLKFQVLDQNGKLVQERKMSRYDGIYKTQVSLMEYPSGLYFIRFLEDNLGKMIKIVKI